MAPPIFASRAMSSSIDFTRPTTPGEWPTTPKQRISAAPGSPFFVSWRIGLLLILVGTQWVAACAPTRAHVAIRNAEEALDQAVNAGAEANDDWLMSDDVERDDALAAPKRRVTPRYYVVKARLYLDAAYAENGRAQFEKAAEYAAKSRRMAQWADLAQAKLESDDDGGVRGKSKKARPREEEEDDDEDESPPPKRRADPPPKSKGRSRE